MDDHAADHEAELVNVVYSRVIESLSSTLLPPLRAQLVPHLHEELADSLKETVTRECLRTVRVSADSAVAVYLQREVQRAVEALPKPRSTCAHAANADPQMQLPKLIERLDRAEETVDALSKELAATKRQLQIAQHDLKALKK